MLTNTDKTEGVIVIQSETQNKFIFYMLDCTITGQDISVDRYNIGGGWFMTKIFSQNWNTSTRNMTDILQPASKKMVNSKVL
ncbi:hypothetical protein IO89_16420 [Epilithonimonas lactis]|uniref:Uncharacterized protein n=2 Tax=Epilithonimonas lactis TaxID=421072 RepID=A0A085B9F2_9FLAO|nr:hypothetical protein IO89_16420 [Epilithonimonas lactis]